MVKNGSVVRKSDGRYYKSCPKCGVEQSYLRKNYAEASLREEKLCKSCANKVPENSSHKGWTNGIIRNSFLNKYIVNAELRNLEWSVSNEYLANLLLEQDFKCSLTGWPIDAMGVGGNTASLDRIDSHEGYVEGNVQWVHKMVNMCKQNYSQEDFIDMCLAIAKEKLDE